MNTSMDKAIRPKPVFSVKNGLLFASIVLAVGLAGHVLWRAVGQKTLAMADLEIAPVERQTFQLSVSVSAAVAVGNSVALTAKRTGLVSRVFRQNGDFVQIGDAIVEIVDPNLEQEVELRQRRVDDTRSRLQNLRMSEENARHSHERTMLSLRATIAKLSAEIDSKTELAEEGFLPRQTLENLRLDLEQQKQLLALETESYGRVHALGAQQMATVERLLADQQADLDEARSDGLREPVVATIAGQLDGLELKAGEHVVTGRKIAELADTGQSVVTAEIDEFYRNGFTPGQRAVAELEGDPYALTLTEISAQITKGKFKAAWVWDGTVPPGLVTGKSVRLTHFYSEGRATLVLPLGPYLTTRTGAYVFVVTDGVARRRDVRLGRQNAEHVEVLSGLSPGDAVITSGYSDYSGENAIRVRRQ